MAVLVCSAGMANAGTDINALDQVVLDIQDERLADLILVEDALKNSTFSARGMIEAAYRQRDAARSAEAGAARLAAELARQAIIAEEVKSDLLELKNSNTITR